MKGLRLIFIVFISLLVLGMTFFMGCRKTIVHETPPPKVCPAGEIFVPGHWKHTPYGKVWISGHCIPR